MASKLEIMAKLRERVNELEREKRETDKRYSEQVSGRGKGGTSSRGKLIIVIRFVVFVGC